MEGDIMSVSKKERKAQKKAFKIAREFYYDCFKIISDLIYGNNVTLGLENLSINCQASYNNCHCHIRKLIFQKYENNSIRYRNNRIG